MLLGLSWIMQGAKQLCHGRRYVPHFLAFAFIKNHNLLRCMWLQELAGRRCKRLHVSQCQGRPLPALRGSKTHEAIYLQTGMQGAAVCQGWRGRGPGRSMQMQCWVLQSSKQCMGNIGRNDCAVLKASCT